MVVFPWCVVTLWNNRLNHSIAEYFFLFEPWRPKGFIQFEIIINVLVSSFWFIWIPMLWVYDLYKYFYSYSAGMDFRRQNLTLQSSDSDV